MTKKLEELFDLPTNESSEDLDIADSVDSINAGDLSIMPDTLAALDKIEAALPAVQGLEASDTEMDELAAKATKEFDNLMDLGMNVDSRYASEIFGVASQMLGHAITAKTAKLDKKLKMIDLQMKKMRLDQQQQVIDSKDPEGLAAAQTAHGVVLSRNDLLERIIGKGQNTQKE